MTPTLLEALHNDPITWITVTPTSLPALTLGINNLKFTKTSGVVSIVDRTLLETLYSSAGSAGSWVLPTTLSEYYGATS